jgi:hypothetical protein
MVRTDPPALRIRLLRLSLDVGPRVRYFRGSLHRLPLKIELAAELRKQTAISMGWIAKELNAGAPNRV